MVYSCQTIVCCLKNRYKITLSYLQLYMEAVLDLLEPEKDQLSIQEDPTSGEVICNGAKVVEVTNMEGLLRILKVSSQSDQRSTGARTAASLRCESRIGVYFDIMISQF